VKRQKCVSAHPSSLWFSIFIHSYVDVIYCSSLVFIVSCLSYMYNLSEQYLLSLASLLSEH